MNTETTAPAPPLIELADAAIAPAQGGDTPVLDQVTWRVEAGDWWVIGALPGSGKTDLLTTAAGLQPPLRGSHRLSGCDISQLPEHDQVRRRLGVGMVFAGGGRLFSHMTVAENIALPLRYHHNLTGKNVSERLQQLLHWTGLEAMSGRLPRQLTHRWRQRAALARALALQPGSLLLDNPLAGLDMRHTHWWLSFLTALSEGHPATEGRRVTLVAATDDMRPWLEHGRQFALLKDRRWIQLGDRASLDSHDDHLLQELLASNLKPV